MNLPIKSLASSCHHKFMWKLTATFFTLSFSVSEFCTFCMQQFNIFSALIFSKSHRESASGHAINDNMKFKKIFCCLIKFMVSLDFIGKVQQSTCSSLIFSRRVSKFFSFLDSLLKSIEQIFMKIQNHLKTSKFQLRLFEFPPQSVNCRLNF